MKRDSGMVVVGKWNLIVNGVSDESAKDGGDVRVPRGARTRREQIEAPFFEGRTLHPYPWILMER
jgi:hypothetical protein